MSSEIHAGHRERLRQRFSENGFDGFQQHEILEFVLGYAIPQKDLNPLAHELIDRFGSLSGVLDASADDLKKVNGIGDYSAALYTPEQIGEFLKPKFLGFKHEMIYGIFMDNKCSVLKHCRLSEGSANSVPLCTRKICEIAFQTGATAVVIAHNHPNGIPLPSKEDIINTSNLSSCLKCFDISLVDHLIYGDDDFVSLASSEDFKKYFD